MKDRLQNLSPWQLAAVSGVLVGLSYPPLKLGLLSWAGLVPLLKAWDQSSPGKSAALGYLAGMITNVLVLYWLSFNSGAPFPVVFASMMGAVIYLSLSWCVVGYLFSAVHVRTGKGFLVLPFLWVFSEYVFSFGPLGFPWVALATSQAEYLPVIQMVEFTGIYGISFWVVLLNVVVYRCVGIPSPMGHRVAVWGAVLLVAPWLFGYARIAKFSSVSESDPVFSVAAVQPNVGPHEKWDPVKRNWVFGHLDSMYVEAAGNNPDMIIWPESAIPAYLRRNARRLRQVSRRVRESGIPLLTGSIDWERSDGERKIHNSVLLVSPGKPVAVYNKIHLVPLAEYNPLSNQFPLSDELSLGHFSPGTSYPLFSVGNVTFSAVICYESAFPQLVRRFVKAGAQFLVVVVNDGWFGNTSEPYQHAALARFRAIEHRMPVVRSANTGISGIYRASGRITERLPVGAEGIIYAGISPRRNVTFYTRFGDIFAQLCSGAFFLLGLWFWRREK